MKTCVPSCSNNGVGSTASAGRASHSSAPIEMPFTKSSRPGGNRCERFEPATIADEVRAGLPVRGLLQVDAEVLCP